MSWILMTSASERPTRKNTSDETMLHNSDLLVVDRGYPAPESLIFRNVG